MNRVTFAETTYWIGAGLEGVGLLVAVVGFRQTWREFSTGGHPFGNELERIKRAGRAVTRFVRRHILRRERDIDLPAVTVTIAAKAPAATLSARGYVGLPSVSDDPKAFAAAVEARLRNLNEVVHSVHERLEDEVGAREAADRRLGNDLEAKVAAVEGLSRQVAVGGLRTQIAGWSCIALGFVLQSVAAPFM